jgi:hypothetical protein
VEQVNHFNNFCFGKSDVFVYRSTLIELFRYHFSGDPEWMKLAQDCCQWLVSADLLVKWNLWVLLPPSHLKNFETERDTSVSLFEQSSPVTNVRPNVN